MLCLCPALLSGCNVSMMFSLRSSGVGLGGSY